MSENFPQLLPELLEGQEQENNSSVFELRRSQKDGKQQIERVEIGTLPMCHPSIPINHEFRRQRAIGARNLRLGIYESVITREFGEEWSSAGAGYYEKGISAQRQGEYYHDRIENVYFDVVEKQKKPSYRELVLGEGSSNPPLFAYPRRKFDASLEELVTLEWENIESAWYKKYHISSGDTEEFRRAFETRFGIEVWYDESDWDNHASGWFHVFEQALQEEGRLKRWVDPLHAEVDGNVINFLAVSPVVSPDQDKALSPQKEHS